MILPLLVAACSLVKTTNATLLHRLWVADKSVYVLRDTDDLMRMIVTRYVETPTGMKAVSQVVTKHFVLGSGPGREDSLLLICQRSDASTYLARLKNDRLTKIGKCHGLRLRIDPELTITESNTCIELQDPSTQGDSGELDIWLYHDGWTGPLARGIQDQWHPINGMSSGQYDDSNLRIIYREPGYFGWSHRLPLRQLDHLLHRATYATPIPSLSKTHGALWVENTSLHWFALVAPTNALSPLRVSTLLPLQINDTLRQEEVFADSRGRIWTNHNGKSLTQVPIKGMNSRKID